MSMQVCTTDGVQFILVMLEVLQKYYKVWPCEMINSCHIYIKKNVWKGPYSGVKQGQQHCRIVFMCVRPYFRKASIALCCCSSWLVRWSISLENVWQRGIPGIHLPVRWWSMSTTDLGTTIQYSYVPFIWRWINNPTDKKWSPTRASVQVSSVIFPILPWVDCPQPFKKQTNIICTRAFSYSWDLHIKAIFSRQNRLSRCTL